MHHDLFSFLIFFIRSASPCLPPVRTSLTLARAAASSFQSWPPHKLWACPALARPHLDGFEHDGAAWCGRDDDQSSRHNLVSGRSHDLNHDAVMRIGSEAPERRTHSSNRHESQGTCRDCATSNHHQRPTQAYGQDRNCRVPSGSSIHCAGHKTRHCECCGRAAAGRVLGRVRNHRAEALFFWNMSNCHADGEIDRSAD